MMRNSSPKLFAVAFMSLAFTFLHFLSIQQDQNQINATTPITGKSIVMEKPVTVNTPREIPEREVPEESQPAFKRQEQVATGVAVSSQLPLEFRQFVSSVTDGSAGVVRGVYVESDFSMAVVQQPPGDPAYVSSELDIITQFQNAAFNGIIGLLAHNYLSGDLFYRLEQGDEVRIVYGDGTFKSYRVTEIQQYEKLEPNSLKSDLVDLSTGERKTTLEVFNYFYNGSDHITFQTCLERYGNWSWGLTFIKADPIP